MRTALLLLFLLALAAIPGSLVPQRPVAPQGAEAYAARHPDLAPWLERLGVFDVFAAPWFAAIYLLLLVSLIGCVVPRTWHQWKTLRQPPPHAPARLDRLPSYAHCVVQVPPEAAARQAAAALGVRWRRRTRPLPMGGMVVDAERGRLREAGNLLFHLSVVALLLTIGWSSFGGFRGNVLLLEGQAFTNSPAGYDDLELSRGTVPEDLPIFQLSLERARATFADNGTPTDFRADVSWARGFDAPAQRGVITVNHPLDVGGPEVFLANVGYSARLRLVDGSGRETTVEAPCLPQDRNFTSTCLAKLPDAQPLQVMFSATLLPTAALDDAGRVAALSPRAERPRLVLMPYAGDLGLDTGRSQNVFALPTEGLERPPAGQPCEVVQAAIQGRFCPLLPANARAPLLAPGETVELGQGAGRVTFDGIGWWGRITVTQDRGRLPLLVAVTALLVGITTSLYGRRRRLWVRATPHPVPAACDGPAPYRTLVEIGGLARNTTDSADSDVDTLAQRMVERCGTPSTSPAPRPRGTTP